MTEPALQLTSNGPETSPVVAGQPLFVRLATKDGRRVVVFRSFVDGGRCVVDADVYPTKTLSVEPLKRGPYAFETLDDAVQFVEQSLLALEYLGCTVS